MYQITKHGQLVGLRSDLTDCLQTIATIINPLKNTSVTAANAIAEGFGVKKV